MKILNISNPRIKKKQKKQTSNKQTKPHTNQPSLGAANKIFYKTAKALCSCTARWDIMLYDGENSQFNVM